MGNKEFCGYFQEKNIPLGTVTIPVASVTSRSLIEKWHQVKTDSVKAAKESPSLRIRCKFQTVEVLPLEMYNDFLNVSLCFSTRYS